MDDIDKLNLIFKADNIELGLQLVKSLGLNLKDVLVELYDRYKFDYSDEAGDYIGIWWVLNQESFEGSNAICIREIEENVSYVTWFKNPFNKEYNNKWHISLNECFDLLVNCLEKGKWNT